LLVLLTSIPFFSETIYKYLFKLSVQQVIIEISSACNRKCGYCPTSFVNRPFQQMDEFIFNKILFELSSIGYSNSICLNLYNEPLFFYSQLLEYLKRIKIHLPKTKILFSSNGDFINTFRLKELQDAGLDSLFVTIHPDDEVKWNHEEIVNRIKGKCSDWGLEVGDFKIFPGGSVHCDVKHYSMEIQLFSFNFVKIGVNRAGALRHIESSNNLIRKTPCLRPLHDITISYDGTVYPCCQFYHGYKPHQKFLLGNVSKSNLTTIYFSDRMRKFRKMASGIGNKMFPCTICAE
jgi:radical SAM protein with 4Fe4S-binding SPASM domain